MADVLVVDDEPTVLQMVAEALTEAGFAVATAADGDAALTLMEDGLRPNLVLADVMMPRLTGPELVATLHARHGADAPPVALMSANHAAVGRADGVVARLRKPFSIDALVRLAHEYSRG